MSKKLPFRTFNVQRALKDVATVTVFSTLLFLSVQFTVSAQSELLRDLNGAHEKTFNEFSNLIHGGANMYFIMNNALWKSTGTPASTVGVKRFNSISNLTMAGSTLYFSADDGVSGVELWKSNGTTAGTLKVKDIYTGRTGSAPQNLTNVNGRLYFSATNGTNGRELWRSDGTAAGTVMVKDILKVSGSSNPGYLTPIGSTLYFVANDGMRGYEVWKSNGTAEGTVMVKDIRTGDKASSLPQYLTSMNGTLYFGAIDNTSGRELWKSNGTAAGTVRVKDIRAGASGSRVENLINVNGTLFFSADDGINGYELWKSNGTATGTVLVKDLNPGAAGSNNIDDVSPHGMSNFRNINGILYFTASKFYQDYIYRSDGTAAGTFVVQPIQTGSYNEYEFGIAYPDPEFTYLNGNVYFFNSRFTPDDEAPDGGEWYYLWKMPYNGTTPTPVKLFYRPFDGGGYVSNYRQEMIMFNNLLFTFGRVTQTSGFAFIRSDGTEGGTYAIKDPYIPTLSSIPNAIITAGNLTYMIIDRQIEPGYPDQDDNDLYRTDGTTAGTYFIMDDVPDMVKVGTRIFFMRATSNGFDLWQTEGTAETTRVVKAGFAGRAFELTDVNGILYFGLNDHELWRSDGTAAGTIMIADIPSGISRISSSAGRAFILSDGISLSQLWLANETGVTLVKTIRDGGGYFDPHKKPEATIGNVFYFVASDGVHGNEIWRTDGTSAGTYMLFDLEASDSRDFLYEYGIDQFTVLNSRLYFTVLRAANQGIFYTTGNSSYTKIRSAYTIDMVAVADRLHWWYIEDYRLYHTFSNGEPSNTYLVTFIYIDPNSFGFPTVDHAVINDILFYAATGGKSLYRSAGTACNSNSFNTGTNSVYPIEPLGNSIVFFGHRSTVGNEPNIFRNATTYDWVDCGPAATAAREETGEPESLALTPYPNPFATEFTIRFDGREDETAEVSVFSTTGFPVETLGLIRSNTDYANVGTTWPKGMYIIKVNRGGKVTTQVVVKK
jgi:ELWxxDGT repeat protein